MTAQLDWSEIGDLHEGRPSLGSGMSAVAYRLFQASIRAKLEERLGVEGSDRLVYEAGQLAGCALYEQLLAGAQDIEDLARRLSDKLKDLGIGVLRLVEHSPDGKDLAFTIHEDLDCSGMPDKSVTKCQYDEGVLAGVLGSFYGANVSVKEVECWGTGHDACRFEAHVTSNESDG